MIHLNHMVVISDQGFARRKLRDLFCGCAPVTERRACARGWGLDRAR